MFWNSALGQRIKDPPWLRSAFPRPASGRAFAMLPTPWRGLVLEPEQLHRNTTQPTQLENSYVRLVLQTKGQLSYFSNVRRALLRTFHGLSSDTKLLNREPIAIGNRTLASTNPCRPDNRLQTRSSSPRHNGKESNVDICLDIPISVMLLPVILFPPASLTKLTLFEFHRMLLM